MILRNTSGQIRREQGQRHAEHRASWTSTSSSPSPLRSCRNSVSRTVAGGQRSGCVRVIDTHHDRVHPVAMASQERQPPSQDSLGPSSGVTSSTPRCQSSITRRPRSSRSCACSRKPSASRKRGRREEPLRADREHDVMHHRELGGHRRNINSSMVLRSLECAFRYATSRAMRLDPHARGAVPQTNETGAPHERSAGDVETANSEDVEHLLVGRQRPEIVGHNAFQRVGGITDRVHQRQHALRVLGLLGSGVATVSFHRRLERSQRGRQLRDRRGDGLQQRQIRLDDPLP